MAQPAPAPPPPQLASIAHLGRAPVTRAILVALAACYAGEVLAAGWSPVPDMLVAFGGLFRPAVLGRGEWYRILTATLLHASFVHVLLNGICLVMAGVFLESLIGSAWFLAIYLLSSVGGSLLGLRLNGDNLVSVGASGAIMGLLAAGFIAAYRLPKEAGRTQVQGRLARILVPSLVPLAVSFEGKIDYSAHFGGAVTGSLLGLLLLATWPRQEPHPRLKEAATAVAGMGLAVLGYSVYAAASRYPALAEDAKLSAPLVLVADKDIPSDVAEAERTADIWGKDRPRDPRVHYYRALQLLRDHDPEGAKKELDIGLAEKGIFHKFFPNRMLETGMRTLLCAILIDADRKADAEVEAKPVCDAGEGGGPPERMTKLGLCGQSRK